MLPEHPPKLPFLYLDWNTVQHLASQPGLDRLLVAIARARVSGALVVPFSPAHLMDATAGWTSLTNEHRAARLRSLMFLEGLSASAFWTVEGNEHRLVHAATIETCDDLGYFDTVEEDGDTAQVFEEVRARVKQAAAGLRADPSPLSSAMADALERELGNGPRDLADGSAVMSRLLSVAFLHTLEQAPSCNHLTPDQVAPHINQWLLQAGQTSSLDAVVQQFVGAQHHVDDIGPSILGSLGYERDSAKAIRNGAPGAIADQTHARFALSSAIFLTGERRLPRRIEAWAAHTGRGAFHGTWPVVRQVEPSNPTTVAAVADLVDRFTDAFEGEASRLATGPR